MVKVVSGDLFKGGHHALVNPVNLKGIPGALAAIFDTRYPVQSKALQTHVAENGELKFGEIFTTETLFNTPKFILHFPTVPDIGEQSDIRYIAMGMQTLLKHVIDLKIRSIGIPALGCGVGALEFAKVSDTISAFMLEADNCDTYIYKPLE